MNQDTQELFHNFTAVIRELAVLAGDIATVEERKAEAAVQKRHQLLDGFIQKEQAQILKLRGLEQRRIRMAKELGWESLTFRQILEKAEPEQKESLSPLFAELEQNLKRLGQSRQSAEQIIKVRIREIETAIARGQGGSYDNQGGVSPNTPPRNKMKDTYV